MDVLLTHKQVVEDYASYIQSFLNIQIRQFARLSRTSLPRGACGQSRFFSSTRQYGYPAQDLSYPWDRLSNRWKGYREAWN